MTPPASPKAQSELSWPTQAAALLGALAVAAGAFGAHALKARVPPADLEIWRTGAHYHLIHALALLVVSLAPHAESKVRRRSCVLFTVGVAIFAGTLYAMVLGGPRWLGAITPIGGASLILGWLSLLAPPR